MTVPSDVFGVAYLDAESFRAAANLFGVGMSLADYPDDDDGGPALNRVLQAASRAIDSFCGKVFTPDALTEQQPFDQVTWQFSVNNPPVAAVSSCVVRFGIGSSITIPPEKLYINNQKGYVEIAQDYQVVLVTTITPLATLEPVIEVTYTSLAAVPKPVALAAGYQAAHMINNGFVSKVLPPDFGSMEIGGLDINNRRGSRSADELQALTISPEAERLLMPFKQFAVA